MAEHRSTSSYYRCRVLGEKNVARTDKEVLAFARLEIQRSTQRNDQLPDGRGTPGEGTAGGRLLKGGGHRRYCAAQDVAALGGLEVDEALLEMRVLSSSVHIRTLALPNSGPAVAERISASRTLNDGSWVKDGVEASTSSVAIFFPARGRGSFTPANGAPIATIGHKVADAPKEFVLPSLVHSFSFHGAPSSLPGSG